MDKLARRVLQRYTKTADSNRYDGKLVSKEWRLRWNDWAWLLEELPTKGKRKLQVAELQNPYGAQHRCDPCIPANILRQVHISTSDSFDTVKDKILEAQKQASVGIDWAQKIVWYTHLVYFLEVIPEGTDPFVAEGKDFKVSVSWDKFSAYSPSSDFQQMDPHYIEYASSAPLAARKLYQTLKANPDALKAITWDKFDEWLKANKISYKCNFSSWH